MIRQLNVITIVTGILFCSITAHSRSWLHQYPDYYSIVGQYCFEADFTGEVQDYNCTTITFTSHQDFDMWIGFENLGDYMAKTESHFNAGELFIPVLDSLHITVPYSKKIYISFIYPSTITFDMIIHKISVAILKSGRNEKNDSQLYYSPALTHLTIPLIKQP